MCEGGAATIRIATRGEETAWDSDQGGLICWPPIVITIAQWHIHGYSWTWFQNTDSCSRPYPHLHHYAVSECTKYLLFHLKCLHWCWHQRDALKAKVENLAGAATELESVNHTSKQVTPLLRTIRPIVSVGHIATRMLSSDPILLSWSVACQLQTDAATAGRDEYVGPIRVVWRVCWAD